MMKFSMDSKSIEVDVIQSRSMSDPTLSDIDFKNKMAWFWTALNGTIPTHKIFIKNWLRNASAKNKSCFNFS